MLLKTTVAARKNVTPEPKASDWNFEYPGRVGVAECVEVIVAKLKELGYIQD